MKRLAEFKEVYTDIRDLIYSIALIEYGEDNNKYRGYKFEKLEKLDTDKMYFIARIKYYTEQDLSTYEIHIKDSEEDPEKLDIIIMKIKGNGTGDIFTIREILDMIG